MANSILLIGLPPTTPPHFDIPLRGRTNDFLYPVRTLLFVQRMRNVLVQRGPIHVVLKNTYIA